MDFRCRRCKGLFPQEEFTLPNKSFVLLCKECRKIRGSATVNVYRSIKEARLAEQGEMCAICGVKPIKKPHLDHNHNSGQIRGVLCLSCNRGLGVFKESIKSLTSAVRYLQTWKSRETKVGSRDYFVCGPGRAELRTFDGLDFLRPLKHTIK